VLLRGIASLRLPLYTLPSFLPSSLTFLTDAPHPATITPTEEEEQNRNLGNIPSVFGAGVRRVSSSLLLYSLFLFAVNPPLLYLYPPSFPRLTPTPTPARFFTVNYPPWFGPSLGLELTDARPRPQVPARVNPDPKDRPEITSGSSKNARGGEGRRREWALLFELNAECVMSLLLSSVGQDQDGIRKCRGGVRWMDGWTDCMLSARVE
jgi:hypothetical protein